MEAMLSAIINTMNMINHLENRKNKKKQQQKTKQKTKINKIKWMKKKVDKFLTKLMKKNINRK